MSDTRKRAIALLVIVGGLWMSGSAMLASHAGWSPLVVGGFALLSGSVAATAAGGGLILRRTLHTAGTARSSLARTNLEIRRLDHQTVELMASLERMRSEYAVNAASWHAAHVDMTEQLQATLERLRRAEWHLDGGDAAVEALRRELAALEERSQTAGAAEKRNAQAVAKELKALQRRTIVFRHEALDIATAIVQRADALELGSVFTGAQAAEQLRRALQAGDVRTVLRWRRSVPSLIDHLNPQALRALLKQLREAGYVDDARDVARRMASVAELESDRRAAEIFLSELEVFQGKYLARVETAPAYSRSSTNVVLHMVGKSLPMTQSGYTIRTHATSEAQARAGWRPIVAVQADGEGAWKYRLDGIEYRRLAGPRRGTVNWHEWLDANVAALRELVIRERPQLIHVHSDFVNSLIASPVARAFGIPLVNETRGFWEESWLSRTRDAQGGAAWDRLVDEMGPPAIYSMRAEREANCRSEADTVVTLSGPMAAHIERRAHALQLESRPVKVVPNAVDPEQFPTVEPDEVLRAALGIPAEALVAGYISSLVEYEGVDVLLRAFAIAQNTAAPGIEMWLLIVGDGPERENLTELSRSLGLSRVVFTGQVPHDAVLAHYSLIDVFVVPRRNARVTQLVTPLKPFEAMSTGRACLFADVEALAEIARESRAAALFAADDPDSLAVELSRLARNPSMRADLAAAGAAWVRETRTWRRNATTYGEIYAALSDELR